MENQHIFSIYSSLFLTLITVAYGPNHALLISLLCFMGADYLTGIAAATLDRGLCYKVGYRGMIKKIVILILIALCRQLDILFGTEAVMLGAIYFYISLELISITENAGRLGIPMPQSVRDAIKTLKAKVGDDDGMEGEISDNKVSSDRTE